MYQSWWSWMSTLNIRSALWFDYSPRKALWGILKLSISSSFDSLRFLKQIFEKVSFFLLRVREKTKLTNRKLCYKLFSNGVNIYIIPFNSRATREREYWRERSVDISTHVFVAAEYSYEVKSSIQFSLYPINYINTIHHH